MSIFRNIMMNQNGGGGIPSEIEHLAPYIDGNITYWLYGGDNLVNNCWVDRINGAKWRTNGNPVITADSGWTLSYQGYFYMLLDEFNTKYDFKNHFKIIFDVKFTSYPVTFFDIAAIQVANRNMGWYCNGDQFHWTWKMGVTTPPFTSYPYVYNTGQRRVLTSAVVSKDNNYDKWLIESDSTKLTNGTNLTKASNFDGYSNFSTSVNVKQASIGRAAVGASFSQNVTIYNIVIIVYD